MKDEYDYICKNSSTMIQRIQTVYYLIAVVLLVLVSFGQEIVAFTISGSELNEKIDMNVSSKGIHASATLDLTTEELKEFEKHIVETGAQFSKEETRVNWSNSIPVTIMPSAIPFSVLFSITYLLSILLNIILSSFVIISLLLCYYHPLPLSSWGTLYIFSNYSNYYIYYSYFFNYRYNRLSNTFL
jgi:hypothetical protein